MKKAFFVFFWFSLFIFSCAENKKEVELQPSLGKTNSLTLVITNQLWNGEIGDSLRKKFAAPVDGLPQEEPLFTINQYPLKTIDGSRILSRNVVIIKKEETNSFTIAKNEFAQPQNIVTISGISNAEIISQLEKNADSIVKRFKETEIKETQKSIKKVLFDDKRIQSKFNIALQLPSSYKIVLDKPRFLWLKKETLNGNNSILIYKVASKRILKNSATAVNIIKARDSIGAKYIHSKAKNSRMITEESYAPYFFNTILNGKTTFQTKGTWEITGDFMSGPFINYTILNNKKADCIVIEGFCYAPSTEKRDLMHELEAIIRSVRFINPS